MNEGPENDDKFSMVEDEFLTVAKRFTVHLHAAEYKRKEKIAKARNAQKISSISRPVIGKMPDYTRRRVEGVERAKKQRTALEGLLGKKSQDTEVSDDSDDDSDDDAGLPYVGTTLHGLMDSPRKRAASLMKAGSVATSTRSAAGFKKPAAQSKNTVSESPQPKSALRSSQVPQLNNDSSTESDEDDDLDAPIPAPKLTARDQRNTASLTSFSNSRPVTSTISVTQAAKSIPVSRPSSSTAPAAKEQESTLASYVNTTDSRISTTGTTRPSRVEQARRLRAQQEKAQEAKKKPDVMPTFL